MAVKDYSTNPDENTTISGINVAEGCPPSGINNAIRQLMADVKQESEDQSKVMTGATASAAGTSGNVPAPAAGQQNHFLNGGGKWDDSLDIFRRSLIGVTFTFIAQDIPDGFMICDGSLALFEDWPEFKAAYDSGKFTGMVLDSADSAQVGKFVLNGSSGVYLPDLEGLFVQASAAGTAGAYVAPGLPIPSGTLQGVITDGGSATGVFTYQQTAAMNLTVGGGAKQAGTFSTRASGIYGASTTVQPPSVQYVRAMYLGKPNIAAA